MLPKRWLWVQRVAEVLWYLVLVTLPVTSFRYYPDIFGTTAVMPLAFTPLAFLLPLAFALQWKRGSRHWLDAWVILGAFLFFTAVSSALGGLTSTIPPGDITYASRVVRAWISLGVGLAFFMGAMWMHRHILDLQRSLRALYAGLGLVIVWGFLQTAGVILGMVDFEHMDTLQRLFSIRGLVPGRVSAFAFEPAWLADQIIALYLPWLVASLLTGYRVSRYRWLEPLLFLLSLIILTLTYSRSGILIGIPLLAVFSSAFVISRWLQGRKKAKLSESITTPLATTRRKKWLGRAWKLGLAVVILASLGVLLSYNNYFATLWQYDPRTGIIDYVIDIKAGARLAYAWAGTQVFLHSPWLGVGFGASGFYLYDNLPDWSITVLPEIAYRLSLTPPPYPNIKNLYIRLLAETGLIGFAFFVIFFLYVFGDLVRLFASPEQNKRFTGLAGLWLLLAFLLRAFSQDSLALPNMWLCLGIVLGVSAWTKDEENALGSAGGRTKARDEAKG
ncbi:MAG: O-antigen ligase family protein [Chloroflexota bacterium]